MINIFDRYRKVRMYLLDAVHDLTTEQFNYIPPGFKNNVIWNLAHLIAAQQGVCYLRAGEAMSIDREIFEDYKPGTKPVRFVDSSEIDYFKSLAVSTIDTFEKDYLLNKFSAYKPWTTRYGTELPDINTATEFLFYHEGLHYGYIAALRKNFRKDFFRL